MRKFFMLLLLLLLPASLLALQMKQLGEYQVHYSAVTADFLAPEVARRHGLPRSRAEAVVNISVRRAQEAGSAEAVPSRVEVTATNLHGKVRAVAMKEVREGEALYYLGSLPFTDKEQITFDVSVRPQGTDQSIAFSFSQQFFLP